MMNRKELTTPLGFFNYALSYRAAADKLRICKLRAIFPHAPVLFTYYHSIELYLKAFLRAHRMSVESLQNDIGHDFKKLQHMCVDHGFSFDGEAREALDIMAAPGAWLSTRYLEIGFHRYPRISVLARVCRRIDRQVGAILSKKGVHIRRMRSGVRVSD
jgi:hypothetical protein